MWSHFFLFGSLPRRRPPEFTAILMFEFWREATATSVPGLLCQSGRRRPENVSILSSLLKFWRRSRDPKKGVGTRHFSRGFAKSHSTSTQYRQLRRLLWEGCCAEPLSWNYVLITLSRCKFHFENRIFRFFDAFFHLPRPCRFETRPNVFFSFFNVI